MLGTLSLMACTLLLAAVPSLSSSLQPREEVNLPAIGYVMLDDNRAGISPLAADSSQTYPGSLSDFVDSTVYFADADVGIPFSSQASVLTYIYTSTGGLDVDLGNEYTSSSYIYISVDDTSSTLSVYLPDLSYWTLDGSTYCITVCVSDGSSLYSVYGNVLDGTTLTYVLAELGEDVNPVGAIGDGLGVIGALGGALSSGFDGVFLDNGALTSVGTFSFVLLGLGISVGIVKKCFNWVTGRHGM